MAETSSLGTRPYHLGLHDLGNGGYAWLQPDGGWGFSNAGLIVDGEESLLVDTLFDKPLTGNMLDAMRKAEPRAAKTIGQLVNTHSNGDHCNGNELVHGRRYHHVCRHRRRVCSRKPGNDAEFD